MNQHKRYGLIGRHIDYSFSPNYFNNKFEKEERNAEYLLCDIERIEDFQNLELANIFDGLNVTQPYKESIIPFLMELDSIANEIQAVNCIDCRNKKKIKGFNTDVIGFRESIRPLLTKDHQNALIFGTGGAAKAAQFALKQLNRNVQLVTRTSQVNCLTYEELFIGEFDIIINATPIGLHKEDRLPIQYHEIGKKHVVFDMIYHHETYLLQQAKQQGAVTKNGLEMLEIQAEESWKIWHQ